MMFYELDNRRASFETPAARAPQDDGFSYCHPQFLVILRSARWARLEGRMGDFAAK
jgi:hypothetical protein